MIWYDFYKTPLLIAIPISISHCGHDCGTVRFLLGPFATQLGRQTRASVGPEGTKYLVYRFLPPIWALGRCRGRGAVVRDVKKGEILWWYQKNEAKIFSLNHRTFEPLAPHGNIQFGTFIGKKSGTVGILCGT